MPQVPAEFQQCGDALDYTPSGAKSCGDIVAVGALVGVVQRNIAANEKGALAVRGVYLCPKDASVFAGGAAVYWDDNGSPVGGTALSGAMTSTSGGNTLAGHTPPDTNALTGDAQVEVLLNV